MDFYLYILFTVLFIVAVVIIAMIAPIYRAKKKGKEGEKIIANILGKNIPDKQYVINNFIFKDISGKSRQIDHIYINQYGIWVIETKNYSGTIYGTEDKREWTQVYDYGQKNFKFYNPVKQNFTHIYCLSKLLGVKNIFHNVVVFIGNADLSKITSKYVYNKFDIVNIKTQQSNIHLTNEQMKVYYNNLIQIKSNSNLSEREHIKNIKKMQDRLAVGICPRCGGKLVVRKGKYGEFYGCSNYPKCKFTKEI
ncbi:MAG: NERD domain-containing protein [Christensenellales bacterium]